MIALEEAVMAGMVGDDVGRAVGSAMLRVPEVRTVPTVHVGTERNGRVLVAARVGLKPDLTLSDIVHVVARAQLAAARVLPNGAAVFVEPDVAADSATPTEAIVIRGFE